MTEGLIATPAYGGLVSMGILSLSLPDFQKPLPMPTMTKNFLASLMSL
jgi:hypothetical protein